MTTFREYHDLYLKTDVLLLANVLENFRNVCMKNYELDPVWYYTTPGLSQDACLKMTGVQLELLSDPDMLLMIEQGIRGGVSMISKRYAKTNNKYMGEKFNPNKKSIFILYLDAHNLYGWAMSLPLPVGGFKWMNEKGLKNWREFSDQKGRGCILEVDLEYPKKLYDLHNEYPLAPERIVVNKVEKLIPNLNEKKKYVLHHKNLKQYLDLGLKITKIHRGISFDEKAWLKQYIDLNTNFPTAASSEFEKDFFKLMNNSMFGKTMENIRNRVNIRLVNNQKSLKKCVTKPNFDHYTVFDENLVAVHMKKTELVFHKPVYLGMSILDLSKTLMYDFHYNYTKKNSARRRICCSRTLIASAMKSKQKTSTMTFQKTSKKNLTLQISRQTILQAFQLESTRKFQECLRMRPEGKSLKSLSACDRSSTQSRNSMVKKKNSARVSREMS